MKVLHAKAFTLIELLIVVAIIAILALVATPNFLEAQTRAKVSRVKSDLAAMNAGIEAYAVDHNYYPINGVLNQDGSVQNPQDSMTGPPAHKFLSEGITTPIAYVSTICEDPFVRPDQGPPQWERYFGRYFYTNLAWFTKLTEPNSPPVIAQKMDQYGTWILAGAGPDGDRLDLAKDIYYDPTNGTVSNGDIIRSPNYRAE